MRAEAVPPRRGRPTPYLQVNVWGGAKLLAAEIAAEAQKLARIEAAKHSASVYKGGLG